MTTQLEVVQLDVRALYQVLSKLKANGETSPFVEQSPGYKYWIQYGKTLQALENALARIGKSSKIADHVFSKINVDLFSSVQSMETLERANQ